MRLLEAHLRHIEQEPNASPMPPTFLKSPIWLVLVPCALAALVLGTLSLYGMSLTNVKTNGRDLIVLSGSLDSELLERYKAAAEKTPNLRTLRIKDSPGGREFVSEYLREEVRRKNLSVEIQGGRVSACANIYLSTPRHDMLASRSIRPTYLHFHGTYSHSTGSFLHPASANDLKEVIENTSHKMPLDLYVQARNSELPNGGLLVFRDPFPVGSKSFTSFFCLGNENHRPADCKPLAFSAKDLGL